MTTPSRRPRSCSATRRIRREAANVDTPRTAYAQGWFAMLRTLVQFEKWDEILAGEMLPVYAKPRQEAWRRYARALAQANKDNAPAAIEEAKAFEAAVADFQKKTTRPEPAELQVARLEIAGHLEAAQGRVDRGMKVLAAASKAERKLTYTEPPFYPRPVAEALGHLASRKGKTGGRSEGLRRRARTVSRRRSCQADGDRRGEVTRAETPALILQVAERE